MFFQLAFAWILYQLYQTRSKVSGLFDHYFGDSHDDLFFLSCRTTLEVTEFCIHQVSVGHSRARLWWKLGVWVITYPLAEDRQEEYFQIKKVFRINHHGCSLLKLILKRDSPHQPESNKNYATNTASQKQWKSPHIPRKNREREYPRNILESRAGELSWQGYSAFMLLPTWRLTTAGTAGKVNTGCTGDASAYCPRWGGWQSKPSLQASAPSPQLTACCD